MFKIDFTNFPECPRRKAIWANVSLFGILLLSLPVQMFSSTFNLSISGAEFLEADGVSPLAGDRLLQLVQLGPNGVSDPIRSGFWTGGDDVLIDLPFGSQEFDSSGGFDLAEGAGALPGLLTRSFSFEFQSGVVESGAPFALRWWPKFSAADFHSGDMLPEVGDVYGEARTTSAPGSNDHPWVFPAAATLAQPITTITPLVSPAYNASVGGALVTTPDFNGAPASEVMPIPEPASLRLLCVYLIFVLPLLHRERSRKRTDPCS